MTWASYHQGTCTPDHTMVMREEIGPSSVVIVFITLTETTCTTPYPESTNLIHLGYFLFISIRSYAHTSPLAHHFLNGSFNLWYVSMYGMVGNRACSLLNCISLTDGIQIIITNRTNQFKVYDSSMYILNLTCFKHL